jgi:hypothetical protein
VVRCLSAENTEDWHDRLMLLVTRGKSRPLSVVGRRADNVRYEAPAPDFGVFVRCFQ